MDHGFISLDAHARSERTFYVTGSKDRSSSPYHQIIILIYIPTQRKLADFVWNSVAPTDFAYILTIPCIPPPPVACIFNICRAALGPHDRDTSIEIKSRATSPPIFDVHYWRPPGLDPATREVLYSPPALVLAFKGSP